MTLSGPPDAVTNRIFSVTLQLGGQNPSLFSDGKQVAAVGMAIDSELDRVTRLRETPNLVTP